MSGFRMRPVELVSGLIGAALVVTALFLWAVTRLQLSFAHTPAPNPTLFVVPGVVGVAACVAAVLPLASVRRHRAGSASASAEGAPAPAATSENTAA